MRGGLVRCLVIASMAQVTKITESMLGMPGGPIGVDRFLSLGLMAAFTGGSLRAALRLGRGRHQEGAERHQEQTDCQENEGNSFLSHAHLVLVK
jgi:hypothetical protein